MTFADRVRARELVAGTFVSSASLPVAESLASSGLDFLLVDLEHGVPDRTAAIAIVRSVSPRLPVLLRIPPEDAHAAELALDAGAAGIVVPRVDTAEDLDRHFARTSYAVSRGFARVVPAWNWGSADGDPFAADAGIVRIAQIETVDALDNATAIAAHPLVDAVFLGPADLALDARRRNRDVGDAAAIVARAASDAGKPCATLVPSPDDLARRHEQGYTLIAVSADLRIVSEAGAQIAAAAAKASSPR